jgi:CheY-like chemotaxis protein
MIVDDHAEFRRVVKAVLRTAGWDCVECQNGQEAVDQYANEKPDLVLMDIAMEHLDGISATAQIKAQFPGARIMIVTQYDDQDLRAAADKAGACGYILKENLLGLRAAIQAQTPALTNGSNGGAPLSLL